VTAAPTRRRLRVVTLIDNPAPTGGGERVAVTVASALDPARFDRILYATREIEGPRLDTELEEMGVAVRTLTRHSRAALWAWAPFVSFLRHERIDVLHAHKFGSNVWGTLLGRVARVPVVIAHEHGGAWPANRIRSFLNRELIGRGADAFLAVSAEWKHRLVEVEGVNADRVRFLTNGIPPWPSQPTHDVREELGIDPDAPVVATVCQLRPEKALDLLIETAGALRAEFPGVRVLIAGDGPAYATLRSLVEATRLEETVLLLGIRRDVPDLLAAADVAVCCSDWEGTPLSVIEYMAAGKPIVATRVGGLPDLLEDGVEGVFVEPRDVGGLTTAIGELFRDDERRRTLGEHARERQRREFGLAEAVRRLEDLYEELFRQTARAHDERWAPFPRAA
jgi:glycosyltransferase involved in cell wall biosynthesis